MPSKLILGVIKKYTILVELKAVPLLFNSFPNTSYLLSLE